MQGIDLSLGPEQVQLWKSMLNTESDGSDGVLRDLLQKRSEEDAARVRLELKQSTELARFSEQRRQFAEQASSAVLASSNYTENCVYRDTNLGKNPRIDVGYCIHPLSADECDIYTSLVEDAGSSVVCMPNHCITPLGDASGFKFQCREGSNCSLLPVGREMYFRHSMVECAYPERSALDSSGENVQVLGMLMRQGQALDKLVSVVQRIHSEAIGNEACFECMPENYMSSQDKSSAFGTFLSQRAPDNRDWRPEMPKMVGIFHAYVKDINRRVRLHKLFIVVSGGCTMASDRFYNMFIDVRNHVTCKEFADSEESWYLNDLNKRSNARILHMVAREFMLDIPTTVDTHAYNDNTETASCCTESTTHSIHRDQRARTVTVTNCCMDPRTSRNGVLCSAHLTQGLCLFKGPVATNQSDMVYGGPFGYDALSGPACFPTTFPQVTDGYSFKCKPPAGSPMQDLKMPTARFADTSIVARLDAHGNRLPAGCTQDYVAIDETIIRKLSTLQWNRDNGMVELMPIAVVVTESGAT